MGSKNTNRTDRLLRLPQVLEIVPLGKSTIWAYVKEGRFPAPVKISSRCSAWKESEVKSWMAQLSHNGGHAV